MYQIPVYESHPPALQALQALMAEALEIDRLMRPNIDWAKRALEHCRPEAWTHQVERNLDNPDELEILRKERREALITGDAVLFGHYATNDRLSKIQDQLFGAIAAVVEHINSITMHHKDTWLRPILVNAVLQAEEIRNRRRYWNDEGLPARHDADRDRVSLAALKSAFQEVCTVVRGLRDHTWDNNHLDYSIKSYPTEGAVTPKSLGRQFQRDEMRSCPHTHFVDTVNSEHPALRELAVQLAALNEAIKRVREANKALRSGEKGRVNERQYAARVITLLDNPEGGCGSYSPKQIKDEQEKQGQARLAYQSARVVFYAEIIAADEMRRAVLKTLRAAIVECETLETEIEGDQRATTDKLFTRRLALINCISADEMLRWAGRELQEHFKEYNTDLTSGKANRATEDAYDKVRRYYDSFKPRPAATTSDGGGVTSD